MYNVYITGDIHGKSKRIREFCKSQKTERKDTLILLGDAGFNYFFNERDKKFKEKVNNCPITIFTIRGNHEARPQEIKGKWHYELYFDNRVIVEDEFPNIKYALDGYDYYINGCRAFIIGGAYSVDKFHRLANGWSWFENEQLNEQEQKNIIDYLDWLHNHQNPIDLFLTHTCPIKYEPTDLFLPMIDQSMVDKSMERFLGEVEKKYKYKLWCFGHFHGNRIYPYKENEGQILMLFDKIINLEDLPFASQEDMVNFLK